MRRRRGWRKKWGMLIVSVLFTSLSASALACSSFLDLDAVPATFGLESFRVTVKLKTRMCASGVKGVVGRTESLSTTKKPRRSN